MRRWHVLLSTSAASLALAVIVLHGVAAPLLPSHVNVRWREATTAAQRAAAEQELALESGEATDQRTWRYVVRNRTRGNLARIVSHRLIEDTYHIDPNTFTLAIDPSDAPPWVQSVARSSVFQQGETWLPTILIVVVFVLLAGLWPLERRIASVASSTAVRRWHVERARLRTAHGRTVYALALLALASLPLRLSLVFSGGQFYWGDESRYNQTRRLAAVLVEGRFDSLTQRLSQTDHPLFRLIALPPAIIEALTGDNPKIPGAYFALFSAFNVALIGLIAMRLGAVPAEALAAAFVLAVSASFFYFARHLLPYDAAMTLGLSALYLGAGSESRPQRSLLCGVIAGCAFLTYLGYWTLAAAVLVIHVLLGASVTDITRRAVFAGIGLAMAIGVLVGVSALGGKNLPQALLGFSSEVNQGTFSEGWRLPWAYLWHAEHGLLLLWLGAAAWGLATLRTGMLSRTMIAGLLGVAVVYGALVLFSVGLSRFVVYGRLARQLVPFFCLISAAAFQTWRRSLTERMRVISTAAMALLLLAQATVNFSTPLRQVFPADFTARSSTVDRSITGGAQVIAVNAEHLYPGPKHVVLPSQYEVLRQAPHPLQFIPYQYEGYTPAQRDALRSTDISMKLLLVHER